MKLFKNLAFAVIALCAHCPLNLRKTSKFINFANSPQDKMSRSLLIRS